MKLIISTFFILFVLALHADTTKLGFKTTKINTIHPMSVDRVHCPACSGYTRIYIKDSNSAWGDTDCRADAADIILMTQICCQSSCWLILKVNL